MNYQELRNHIASIEAQKADLEAKAEEMRQSAVAEMVENVRKYIEDNGFTVSEICAGLRPAPKPAKTFYNPDNPEETYSKGPVPAWFKDRMTAAGLSPGDKAAVQAFKETLPTK